MNKMKPIWMRNPREVKDEEYAEFYKSTFKAWDEVAAHTHFSLEGQVEFRALLFVPSVLPYELSRNMFDETSRNMRLYVKRVFINDKFEELLPRWLMFLRGVVSGCFVSSHHPLCRACRGVPVSTPRQLPFCDRPPGFCTPACAPFVWCICKSKPRVLFWFPELQAAAQPPLHSPPAHAEACWWGLPAVLAHVRVKR